MGSEERLEAPEHQVSAPGLPVLAGRRPSRGPLGVTHSAQNEFKRWYAAGQNYHYAVANWLALRNGEEEAAVPELSKHSFSGLSGASSFRRGRVVAARCLAFTPPASAPTSAAPSTQTSPLRREPEDARTAGRLIAGAPLEEGASCRPISPTGLLPTGSRVRSVLLKLEAASGQLRLSCNEERLEEARRRLRPQASAPERGGYDVTDGAAVPATLASRSSLPQRPSWMPAAGQHGRAANLLSSLSVDCSSVSRTQSSNSNSTAGSGRSDGCRSACGSGSTSASSSAGGSHADSSECSWAAAGSSIERDTSTQRLDSLCADSSRACCESGGCSRSSSIGGGSGGCHSGTSSPRSKNLLASQTWRKSGWQQQQQQQQQQQAEACTGGGVGCNASTAGCAVPHSNSASGWLSPGRRLTSQALSSGAPASGWRPGLTGNAVAEESGDALGDAAQCAAYRIEEDVQTGLGGAWQAQGAATAAELKAVAAAATEPAAQESTALLVLPHGSLAACSTPTRHTPSATSRASIASGRGSPREALSLTTCVRPAALEPTNAVWGTEAAPVTPMPATPSQLVRSDSDADPGAGAGASSNCAIAVPTQHSVPCTFEGSRPAEGPVAATTPPHQPLTGRRRRAEAVPVLEPHDLFLAQLLASPQSPAPPTPASRRGPDTGGSSIWTWGRTLASLGRRRKLWGSAAEESADLRGAGVGAEVATASAGAVGVSAADGGEVAAAPADASIAADLLPRFGSEAVLGRPRAEGGALSQPRRARRHYDVEALGLTARAASMGSVRSSLATASSAAATAAGALQRQHLMATADGRRLGGSLAGSATSQHPLLDRHDAQEPPTHRPWRGWSFRPPQRLAALVAGGDAQLQYDLDVLRELEQGWSSQCAMQ